MPYPAKAIANYFLELAASKKVGLSPMKLQKLIYFAHGWNWALRGEPLIEERVEAWDFGPVISEIYHEFKEYGKSDILDLAYEYEFVSMEEDFISYIPRVRSNDNDTTALLDRIWDVYAQYSAVQLSNMTHAKGGAWYKTCTSDSNAGRRGVQIPEEDIREEFNEIRTK